MTTWPITSETALRETLLDLLHGQWAALGVPFSVSPPLHPDELIDPEPLLWCSLEFFPSEPRFREQVGEWLEAHDYYLLRPRVRRFAVDRPDPRASIWHVLDPTWKVTPVLPGTPSLGLDPQEEVLGFCRALADEVQRRSGKHPRPGSPWDWHSASRSGDPTSGPGTALLRARDLIGLDARHFLLTYLLGCPSGARLRAVCDWSGQTYRTTARVAQRWEAAGVIRVDHGFCRLRDPRPWRELLGLESNELVLVDWFRAYEFCVLLLRALKKAQQKGLPADGPVIAALLREGDHALSDCLLSGGPTSESSVGRLRGLLHSRD